MKTDRRGRRATSAAPNGGGIPKRADDELEQERVGAEDARAEAAALAAERDAGAAELLRLAARLREAEGRLRARDEAAAAAQAMLLSTRKGASETESLRSALEEVQVLAEELGEANAALQRSNDALDRTVALRTAALEDANARLRRTEERQRAILESATDCAIFSMDPSGRISSWNAGARNVLGWDTNVAIGMDAAAIFTPEDRAAGAPGDEMRRALADGRTADERWHLRSDGSRFWGDGLMVPLAGEAGPSEGGFLKVLRDRTERRRAEERQALLVGELDHRVKNTLALVLAVLDQTWRAAKGGSGSAEADRAAHAFHDGLRTRLLALSRANELLVLDRWEGADLSDVFAAAVRGGAGTAAISFSGPPVRLAPEASVAMAMALHELATNAAKYGALSVPGGRVVFAWDAAADGRALELRWVEDGGPPVEALPTRSGFGSKMLEQGLARQLGGEIVLEYARQGLRCFFKLPFSDRVTLR